MTQMGTNMVADIWPTLKAEGAVSTGTYTRITPASVTSTNLISGTLGATTYSTGIEFIRKSFRSNEIDGVRIQRGDFMVRFPKSVLSLTPDVDDQLVIGTTTYRVIESIDPVDGASYNLQVRNP